MPLLIVILAFVVLAVMAETMGVDSRDTIPDDHRR
jgi:hypothetical protein